MPAVRVCCDAYVGSRGPKSVAFRPLRRQQGACHGQFTPLICCQGAGAMHARIFDFGQGSTEQECTAAAALRPERRTCRLSWPLNSGWGGAGRKRGLLLPVGVWQARRGSQPPTPCCAGLKCVLPVLLPACCRLMSDWKVELVEDNISEFYVEFGGPKDSELVRSGSS